MLPAHRCRLLSLGSSRTGNERGSAGLELLILATVSVAMLVVVVAVGRHASGPGQANDAAYAAARAASLEPTERQGVAVGRQAATDALADRGKSCRNLRVTFTGSDFRPGGQVIAEVRCTVTLADTGVVGQLLGLRPQTEFAERAVVPIERHRAMTDRPAP